MTRADDTFRTLPHLGTEMPIRWISAPGVVHSCEGADVHPGVRLIWTDCQRDVPANAAVLTWEQPTCPRCKEAADDAR
jgi:hypothetical protein